MSYSYKSIHLPWLSQIPKHWELVRNKVLLYETKNTVGSEHAKYQLLSLTKNGVIIRDISSGKGKFPSDFGTYKTVNDGQIIFCLFDVDETPRTVGLSKHNGMITGAYDVFSINGVNPCFLEYYYILLDDAKAMRPLYTGLRKVISINAFMQTYFPLPPRPEQDQIVRFLDWKVSGINKLINAKRRQIELLREKKRVVVNEAVSNSGNCQKCKLKNLAFFKSGTNLTSLEIELAGKYPVFGGNGLRGYYPEFSHTGEYLLVGRQGALCGNIHYVNEKFWATEHAVTVKPYDIANIRWLYYFLIGMNLNQYSMAAAQPGLSVEYIVNLPAYFPTKDKQLSIAEYLDKKCAQIDSIINKLNDEISLFAEYRTRLISDVVTGKVDVRGVVVPEFEAVEDFVGEEEGDFVADEETS
ncbi:MAG: restriction endonuclease subunit S [Chitinispirillales bacterium]|jgi:type I restriction enzyme S subunit|nr:restriction endonuclease subunit S [Chitinispirillales bacterium]